MNHFNLVLALFALSGISAHAESTLNTAKLCLDAAVATGQVSKETANNQVVEYASRVREINKIARNKQANAAVNRTRAEIIISGIKKDLSQSAIPSFCVWNIESSISKAQELAAIGKMAELAALSQKTLQQFNQIISSTKGESNE